MGQGIGPGRMLPSMSAALAGRGLPGSRGMVNMQMMGSGEEVEPTDVVERTVSDTSRFCFLSSLEMEMVNPAYPQQHGPPNQTAPWPDQMLSMDHYGNQSRSGPCFVLKGKKGNHPRGLWGSDVEMTLGSVLGRHTGSPRRMGWGAAAGGPRASQTKELC